MEGKGWREITQGPAGAELAIIVYSLPTIVDEAWLSHNWLDDKPVIEEFLNKALVIANKYNIVTERKPV